MYDASGVKHQAKYSYSTSTSLISLGATTTENTVASSFQTDYCGNYIYQKSGTGSPKLLRILTPEGYISTYLGMISYLGYWTYTYFLKDHLGNTRVNINSDYLSKNTSKAYGASDQIDYYPFGMERSNTNQTSGGPFNSGTNPYLYNGKEIDRMNGLNENDYGGRWYDAAIGRWGSVDPLAEKYYSISPYAYCLNNPIRHIDPNGKDVYRYDDKTGNLILAKKTDDKYDQIGKFKYDKKTDTYTLKTNKKGEAKTSIDNIEKGILKDGINFKNNDNVINVGGKDQPTVKGFESFALNFSNYIDKEISGYYMSNKSESNTSYIYVNKYKNNTATQARSSFNLYRVRPDLYNNVNINTDYHTHLTRFDDSSRLTPSDADKNTKASELENGVQDFIIITNPDNVHY